MQQLDLFASFDAPPVKEPMPEVKHIVEEPAAPVAAALIADPEEEIIVPGSSKDESLVFADEKIVVKIKPRVAVQPPKLQPVPAATVATATVVKQKSKRGRKSYKEIDAELDLVEVPEDEVLNQKMYYSITEVAKWFKVNASLLRYWENEFDILKPRKNRKGDRLFRPEDIRNLQVIYYLLRNRKFSLEGAKKYLRNHRQQADVNVQLAQSLTKFRSFLLELKANLGA